MGSCKSKRNVLASSSQSCSIITNLEWANRFAHVAAVKETCAANGKIASVEPGMGSWGLTVEDLHGSSRSQTIALARQIAMYLCREMTSMSLPKIGQLFGNRDHTTVMYANKKIEKLMQERRSVYTQVTELTSRIRQTR